MKILNIRFKNLNSLVGEWEIDFTQPDFQNEGIFAITGQTGAGKTTILDAICLALYGRTPRLAKISKNSNEIMSRQTGECFAELTFETQKGRFRCHFSQRRARNKANGELQNPKHEIVDDQTHQVLENHIRKVADKIEEVTGMDFERFTRSILLAQGSFAVFLQSNADERAPILEQITGTEIYSQISIAVHERKNQENQKLEDLSKANHYLSFLISDEQEQDLSSKILIKNQEKLDLENNIESKKQIVQCHHHLAQLTKHIQTLKQQALNLEEQASLFQPQQQRLARAEQAQFLHGDWASLSSLRDEHQRDEIQLRQTIEKLAELSHQKNVAEQRHQTTQQQFKQLQAQMQAQEPIWQKVMVHDDRLQHLKQEYAKIQNHHTDLIKKIHLNNENKSILSKKLIQIQEQLARIQQNHPQNEYLVKHFPLIQNQIQHLQELAQNRANLEQRRQNTHQQYTQLRHQMTEKTELQSKILIQLENLTKQEQNIESKKQDLLQGATLALWQQEKDFLHQEQILRQKIASLENHRQQLHDGEPCPVCGATEHPYALGNVPKLNEIDEKIKVLNQKIYEFNSLEQQFQAIQTQTETIQKEQHQAELALNSAQQQAHATQTQLNDLEEQFSNIQSKYIQQKQQFWQQLEPLGFQQPENYAAVLQALQTRLQAWEQTQKQALEWQKEQEDLIQKIDQISIQTQEQNPILTQYKQDLSELNQKIDLEKQLRFELFQDKNPDTEKDIFIKNLNEIEHLQAQHYDDYQKVHQNWTETQSRQTLIQENITQSIDLLKKNEGKWQELLEQYGFIHEEDFQKARLEPTEYQTLKQQAQQLASDMQENQSLQKKYQHEWADVQAQCEHTDSLADLEQQISLLNNELNQIIAEIAECKVVLEQHHNAKEKYQNQQVKILAQQQECRRWQDLHQLIGSADGKKFRNFAQGLTFDLMVNFANMQLQKMTERYTLVRDAGVPLELNVIDHYQAGELRSTKNLSGGESFLMSLALALGLSQMSSQNVRVDSLFLDEGFGTLDEDALEVALTTLSGLQQEGKLIGVISHVAALKERISTQIQVEALSGGRSVLRGVGCRRINT